MLQELLTLLPEELGPAALTLAIAGAALGLGLWLVGARYSRGLVTLMAVTAGTLLGKNLPGWCDWAINEMGTAVLGAVVLGVAAFVLHRLFVGLALGLLLAWWVGLGTWVMFNDGQQWVWPALADESTLVSLSQELWEDFPESVKRVMPFASGAGFLSGLMAALMWPRVAVVLNWSLAGLSLVLSLGLAAVEHGKREWIDLLPGTTAVQLAGFAGLIGIGAAVQWLVLPASKRAGDEGKAAETNSVIARPSMG